MKNNNYDNFMKALTIEEEYLKHFEEETITLEEDYLTDNIADELAKEKEMQKYIRSFNTYNNI